MVISMLVIMVPLLAIIWFFTNDPEPESEPVNIGAHLAVAEDESPYPVLRAVELPESWTPIRAAWAKDGEPWVTGVPADGNTWMAGYLGPDEIYYGIEQRDRSGAELISRATRDGAPVEGGIEAAGLTWERYESEDGRTKSLVAEEGEMTAVVSADTGFEALEAFATSLNAK